MYPVADDEQDTEDGAFQVTDADREADRDLAIQFATAALTGVASLAGTMPGAVATAFQPIAAAIMTAAVQRLGKRRTEHAADTLMDAADAAGLPLGEFMDQAVSDDRRHELFARSLRIAQDTALRDKRRALGRALAAGVMGDDARIDEEMLFMRAVEDIDEMHIRLLGRMSSRDGAWAHSDVPLADPGLTAGIGALLGALELHGLVREASPEEINQTHTIRYEGEHYIFYMVADAGRNFLARLAEGPET
jgi:hypothetical protein